MHAYVPNLSFIWSLQAEPNPRRSILRQPSFHDDLTSCLYCGLILPRAAYDPGDGLYDVYVHILDLEDFQSVPLLPPPRFPVCLVLYHHLVLKSRIHHLRD